MPARKPRGILSFLSMNLPEEGASLDFERVLRPRLAVLVWRWLLSLVLLLLLLLLPLR